jgi:hypothetical protein
MKLKTWTFIPVCLEKERKTVPRKGLKNQQQRGNDGMVQKLQEDLVVP